MQFILDTANLDQIRRINEFFPIEGVTTNPSIIAAENTDFKKLLTDIRAIIGLNKQFHIQLTETTFEKMVEEAQKIVDFVGGNVYIKVPVSPVGLKVTTALKKLGIKVTQTAILTAQQALLSAKAGADYVAPYVNRIDNLVGDGTLVVQDIVTIFRNYDIQTKVLAASYKNVQQLHLSSLYGAHAVTIGTDIFDLAVSHPMTDVSVAKFESDWKKVYGNLTANELLK